MRVPCPPTPRAGHPRRRLQVLCPEAGYHKLLVSPTARWPTPQIRTGGSTAQFSVSGSQVSSATGATRRPTAFLAAIGAGPDWLGAIEHGTGVTNYRFVNTTTREI